MKKIVMVVGALLLAILIGLFAAGYHGQRDFPTANAITLPPSEIVVANARRLTGTPYDPLMGKHGNVGAKVGFIVCSDVPNIAYGLAGYSLKRMLEEDCKRNPSAYSNLSQDNKPGNPYFHRRARNLYAYFKNNNRLFSPTSAPRVGDLAFYTRGSNGYVSHVALVTELRGKDYAVMESAPETVIAREVPSTSPMERGWNPIGFGRMYLTD